MRKLQKNRLRGTFFVLPAFLLHFCVIVIPACSMFYYAMTDWNGLSQPNFVGFDNFARMIKDTDFLFCNPQQFDLDLLFMTVPLVLGLGMGLIFVRAGKIQMPLRLSAFCRM